MSHSTTVSHCGMGENWKAAIERKSEREREHFGKVRFVESQAQLHSERDTGGSHEPRSAILGSGRWWTEKTEERRGRLGSGSGSANCSGGTSDLFPRDTAIPRFTPLSTENFGHPGAIYRQFHEPSALLSASALRRDARCAVSLLSLTLLIR